MNDLYPALTDALRKAAEKWPDKFHVYSILPGHINSFGICDGSPLVWLDMLNDTHNFTLDHMDAVAAALGYGFDVSMDWDTEHWVAHHWLKGRYGVYIVETYPDKRTASLAALLAIINHALEEK